jgi:tetratricopeptide (TPR) repeat protein
MKVILLLAIGLMVGGGCKPHDRSGSDSFDSDLTASWLYFTQGDYLGAIKSFNETKLKNPDAPEPYAGAGWAYMHLDQLGKAFDEFNAGSAKQDSIPDLFAGWGFVLNAQKDYAGSNAQLTTALALDPNWSFPYSLGLSASDLHVTKAENYFLLGQFSSSLSEVKILDPGFDADIFTNAGQAALAKEIEILKNLSKRRLPEIYN